MSFFLLFVVFLFGACMGSFGAVLIESDSIHRSFWRGRSQCLGCKKVLSWYELIPLVSYSIQEGRCRTCHAKIPRWIWYTEWYMAFLWMIGTMVLDYAGFGYVSIALHLILLSMLSLLVISDMRSYTIPDSISMPLIGAIAVCIGIWHYFPDNKLLPSGEMAIIGGFLGMLFYMLQMLIPAAGAIIRRRTYRDMLTLLLTPFLFPAWILAKLFFGEKKADALFPSLAIFEELPSWVGGGDIRLGVIVGALVGPYHFLWVIMYGYVAGTIYFLYKRLIFSIRMETMPVAPLLFIGVCVLWCLEIFG